jgi:hypothetical protein
MASLNEDLAMLVTVKNVGQAAEATALPGF